jgi:hypothetical protein
VSSYATTCNSESSCMGFAIDTGSSNIPCWFTTATTPPKGDNSGRWLQCLKVSQKFARFPGLGRCQCNENHEGVSCEHKKCPVVNTHVCSSHTGPHVCDQKTGRCICATGFWGDDCSMGNGEIVDLA